MDGLECTQLATGGIGVSVKDYNTSVVAWRISERMCYNGIVYEMQGIKINKTLVSGI